MKERERERESNCCLAVYTYYATEPFGISKSQNPSNDEFRAVWKRLSKYQISDIRYCEKVGRVASFRFSSIFSLPATAPPNSTFSSSAPAKSCFVDSSSSSSSSFFVSEWSENELWLHNKTFLFPPQAASNSQCQNMTTEPYMLIHNMVWL